MEKIFTLNEDFYMGKKITKKASAIRTISLAVGSLSLLVIALSQFSDKEVCTSNAYFTENKIRLTKFVSPIKYVINL